jgi:hypothetical protein
MRCINHPDIETSTKCSECNSALCDSCAINSKNGSLLCRRCEIKYLGSDLVEDIQIRKDEARNREYLKNKKEKRKRILGRSIFVIFTLVVVTVNLYLYERSSASYWSEYESGQAYSLAIVTVDSALQDYSSDHNGKFPENLDELIGPYLDSEELSQSDLTNIHYYRPTPFKYELSLIQPAGEPFSDVIFTESGIK